MNPRNSEAIAFSTDGRLLAVSSGLGGSKHIHLHDLRDPRHHDYAVNSIWLRSLKDTDTVSCLEFRPAPQPTKRTPAPAAHALASGGHSGHLTIWDTTKRIASHRRQCGACPVVALLYSADGAFLASASKDGHVQLWRVEDGYSFVVQLDFASDSIGPAPRLVGGTRGVPSVWMWTPFDAVLGCEKVGSESYVDDGTGSLSGSEDADVAAADIDGASIYSEDTAVDAGAHVEPGASCATLMGSAGAGAAAGWKRALGGSPLCVYDGQRWRIWRAVGEETEGGATARPVDINPSGTLIAYVPENAGPSVIAHIDTLLPDGSTQAKAVLPQSLYPVRPVVALRFSPEGREARLVAYMEDHWVIIWNVTRRQWNTWMKLFKAGVWFGFTPCADYMVLLEKDRKKAVLEKIVSEYIPVLRPRDTFIRPVL